MRIVFVICAMLSFSASALPYVTNVVAKQRYPWNGMVDIAYEIVGSTNGVDNLYPKVVAIDNMSKEVYYASSFENKMEISPGSHVATWDAFRDIGFATKKLDISVQLHVLSKYLVFDFSVDPVIIEELNEVPDNGWSDEYKTTKIVLRRVDPGVFLMLGRIPVTISRPFYIGIFEITRSQYGHIMNSPFVGDGGNRPKSGCSWDVIRGRNSDFPTLKSVSADSPIGKMRSKTGLNFELPTEAQWEYACRAGTTGAFNVDNTDLSLLCRWCGNCGDGVGGYTEDTVVGMYLPNAWGIYDMHGNVSEWVLDWYSDLTDAPLFDPVGPMADITDRGVRYGGHRVFRGGNYAGWSRVRGGSSGSNNKNWCSSTYRMDEAPGESMRFVGFRVVVNYL